MENQILTIEKSASVAKQQNLTINSTELGAMITRAKKAIKNRPILPIIENVLFTHRGLMATNLESTITVLWPRNTQINIDMPFCVDAKQIEQVLKPLKKDTTIGVSWDIATGKAEFSILSPNRAYKFAGLDGEDFPTLPEYSLNGDNLHLNNLDYKKLWKALEFTGSDELRANLTGVSIHNNKIGATDANTLYIGEISGLVNRQVRESYLLSQDLFKLIDKKDRAVNFKFADKHIFVMGCFEYTKQGKIGQRLDYEVVSRLIDESYPDLYSVIPESKNFTGKLTFDKKLMLESIEAAKPAISHVTKQIRFTLNTDVQNLSCQDIEFQSEFSENLPAMFDGEAIEIGFNSEFLSHILKHYEGEPAELDLTSANRAGILTDKNGDLFLIMPVMLNNY